MRFNNMYECFKFSAIFYGTFKTNILVRGTLECTSGCESLFTVSTGFNIKEPLDTID